MNISPLGSLPAATVTPGSRTEVAGNPRQAEAGKGPTATATATILPQQAVAASQQSEETQAARQEQVNDAVNKANKFIQPINQGIEFATTEDTGQMLVKVIDLQTKEVIRQFPSEEMIHIAKALDKLQGLLINNKA